MVNKIISYINTFLIGILFYLVVDINESIPEKRETIPIQIPVNQELPTITIPDTVYFAGEMVPINDPDVRERLDRELHVNTFFHSNTIFILKRGNRWLPQFSEILNQEGIPDDFKYLAVIESDLQNKVSPSDAVGFWQLLKPTAKEFGLEVDNEVDERYNQILSTYVACDYFKRSYKKFGNWTNTAASYNSGMRGLEERLKEQGVENYYDALLNEETKRYVLRAVAIKLIFESPEKYGFKLGPDQLYYEEDLKEIRVDETIKNLRDFAFEHGINYKLLKRYNPWLRKNTLHVKAKKEYTILVPQKKSGTTRSLSGDSVEINDDSLNFVKSH